MQEQEPNLQGNKKFLFNLNNFDEPDQDIPEEEQVPTFSEAELESARQDSYAKGKKDGIDEERGTRDQKVSQTIGQIAQTIQTLVIAEGAREQKYEEESLRLLHAALKNLFPVINKRLGLKEMEDMIERVVLSQHGKGRVIVNVPKGMEGDIELLLSSRIQDDTMEEKYKIIGDDSLEAGSCSLYWEDGGAIRDPEKLINEMIIEVDRLLPADSSDSIALQKDDINENVTEDSGQKSLQSPSTDGESE